MRLLSIILNLIVTLNSLGQSRTSIWELGYAYGDEVPGYEMKYISGMMDTTAKYREIPMWVCSTNICDTSGNLLYFTNGNIIGNRNYDTLKNSLDFNPGAASNSSSGVSYCQAAIFLPYPNDPNKYVVFSESAEYFEDQLQPLHLSYSIIDANLDNGLGAIVDSLKNIHVVEDTLSLGGINSVRHANGRDWWIVVHRYNKALYYVLLLSPEGIEIINQQEIGSPVKIDAHVQSAFSPDGSKYCFSGWSGIFEQMSFDRCTGMFSDLIVSSMPDSSSIAGCSFSPNSRFLYVSGLYNLYQYDTWDSNMIANVFHVATWDSFVDNYGVPVIFHMHQLAPDNRIYMAPWNSSKYLHVIHNPDGAGMECNFQQHSYILPGQFNFAVPTFPNYDLGALQGSSCDTITGFPTGSNSNINAQFRIAPNPVSDWLNIIYQSNEDALFELFDLYGKRVGAISLFHYFKNRLLNVSELPPGVYLAAVSCKGERVWSEKVVVQR